MLRVLSSNEPGTQKGLQLDEHYYYLLMGDFWATVIKTRRKREREREWALMRDSKSLGGSKCVCVSVCARTCVSLRELVRLSVIKCGFASAACSPCSFRTCLLVKNGRRFHPRTSRDLQLRGDEKLQSLSQRLFFARSPICLLSSVTLKQLEKQYL